MEVVTTKARHRRALLTDYPSGAAGDVEQLRAQIQSLEIRVHKGEERRRALLHIMSDLNVSNKRLSEQRKAMLHILVDYEKDRRRLAGQTERLDNSRRALLHILQDAHKTNVRLEESRKAMIHIMGDLRKTTEEIQRREQELRDKQEQLVQAGKLATLGELTTGVAHELNNPLNNIGLYIGNACDQIDLGIFDRERIRGDLDNALQQVRKATEIITHLRTFGRVARVSSEPVCLNTVVRRALSLLHEQLRIRQIQTHLYLSEDDPIVIGNPIQLEQVVINLLTNARDALAEAPRKEIRLSTRYMGDAVELEAVDTGSGIPPGMERRIFDPFFTTKDVGAGTGLGLSITYGIIQEHGGSISVRNTPGAGASFVIRLPIAEAEGNE
jgi:C4-dicarboxylate-specific signal transduction histidine kinase